MIKFPHVNQIYWAVIYTQKLHADFDDRGLGSYAQLQEDKAR